MFGSLQCGYVIIYSSNGSLAVFLVLIFVQFTPFYQVTIVAMGAVSPHNVNVQLGMCFLEQVQVF